MFSVLCNHIRVVFFHQPETLRFNLCGYYFWDLGTRVVGIT